MAPSASPPGQPCSGPARRTASPAGPGLPLRAWLRASGGRRRRPRPACGAPRGARVAHRFALDHPSLLTHLVLLDIAPTYDVFLSTDHVSARARWHWFFHQVPDLPEALTAGREDIYLRFMYKAWAYNPAAIEEEAVQEYVRCFRQPGAMRAGFEDYRAAATLDLEHDRADRERKIAVPTLVLWGAGRSPQAGDMLGVWKGRCASTVAGHALSGSGPLIPPQEPQAVIDAIVTFVAAGA